MKRATIVTIALLLICTAVFAQQKGSLTDTRDKKTYKTVKIGKQTWMAENLNYDVKGSVCYNNRLENCAKYGRLYNWETAMKACPSGWHLPTAGEWKTLGDFAGGWWDYDGGWGNNKLKAKSGWEGELNDGTDNYGFSALPGGLGGGSNLGRGDNGNFYDLGNTGWWWTANERKHIMDLEETMSLDYADFYYMGYLDVDAWRDNASKDILYSVRCIESKCNNQPYNPETHFCYKNKIYSKCNNKLYDPETQTCHTDKKVYSKCGNNIYNPEKQVCHTDKKVYDMEAYQEAMQKTQQEAAQKQQEALQEPTQKYQEAALKYHEVTQEAGLKYQEAIKEPAQKYQKAQQEAMQKYQEAMQKAQQDALKQQEAALKYHEAIQEATQKYQEATKEPTQKYHEVTQEAMQKYQEAIQKYQEAVQKAQQ